VRLEKYLDHLMSILTDETATSAERDAAAKILLPFFHEEVGMEVSLNDSLFPDGNVLISFVPPEATF
jgi:hypothetical protein